VIDQRRLAQREPRSLQPEQLMDLPATSAIAPLKVRAWIVWEDGVEELVEAVATAWAKRAEHQMNVRVGRNWGVSKIHFLSSFMIVLARNLSLSLGSREFGGKS
jgi:hypothetical protein